MLRQPSLPSILQTNKKLHTIQKKINTFAKIDLNETIFDKIQQQQKKNNNETTLNLDEQTQHRTNQSVGDSLALEFKDDTIIKGIGGKVGVSSNP